MYVPGISVAANLVRHIQAKPNGDKLSQTSVTPPQLSIQLRI
jgi:hypothetical protein